MINPELDLAYWRTRLHERGRVQVTDYLQPEAAQRLQHCLVDEVPWTLAIRDAHGPRTIPHSDYAAMAADEAARTMARAATVPVGEDAFRFAYDSYMMVTAHKEGRDPGLVLHRVLEFMNAPDHLAFQRALTADARVRRVTAQATRYRPGQFLRYHTDLQADVGRLYAFVINLTARWEADWGGLLQFIDDDGRVTETFTPRYNTLSLFTVPAGHAVSLVAPWAEADRLAITGWLLA